MFRATRAIPRLGIEVGDRVAWDPEAAALWALWRPILEPTSAELGMLDPLTPLPCPVSGVPQADRSALPSVRARHLRVVR